MFAERIVKGERGDSNKPRRKPMAVDVTYRPCLSAEAESVTVDDLGQLLRHNGSGRYLRLSDAGAQCLALLDGAHTLEDIRTHLANTSGRRVPMQLLADFIVSLGWLRMLEDDVRKFGRRPLSERLRGGLKQIMNIRFGVLPAGRLLDGAAAALRRCPRGLRNVLLGGLIVNGVIAPVLFVLPRVAGLHLKMRDLVGPYVGIVAVLVAIEIVIHELAHGVALTMLGGKVREFGIGLQYLVMVYSYTNTTDGYRLNRRSRIAVSLAGPMVELALLGINAYLFLLVPPGSVAGRVFLLWMIGETIMLLFNVNPLLPVDGYHVLADLLGEPALRAKSVAYLLAFPSRVFGRGKRSYSGREHAIYLFYGLFATVYLLFFIASAFLATVLSADPLVRAEALRIFPWLHVLLP